MPQYLPRYIEKITTAQDALLYTFPTYNYSWRSAQSIRQSFQTVMGADYAIDGNAYGRAPKGLAHETVQCMDIANSALVSEQETWVNFNSKFELAKAAAGESAAIKLWVYDNFSGRRWWAWARISEMPEMPREIGQGLLVPQIWQFERYSHWYDSTEVVLNYNPITTGWYSLTNAGNAETREVEFQFTSLGSGGFSDLRVRAVGSTIGNPVLSDFRYGGLGNTGAVVIIDGKNYSVKQKTSSGGSYTDQYTQLTIPDNMTAFIRLQPGFNWVYIENRYGSSTGAEFANNAPNFNANLTIKYRPAYYV